MTTRWPGYPHPGFVVKRLPGRGRSDCRRRLALLHEVQHKADHEADHDGQDPAEGEVLHRRPADQWRQQVAPQPSEMNTVMADQMTATQIGTRYAQ
ncbi:hypothetical protein [Corynebacterium pilosum]|uniref:hypothetical protein n=1 Tax=Corynebacterium pilosum TaxID=35756 RepID=UPI003B009650